MGTLEALNSIFGGKSLEDLSNRFRCHKCKTKKKSWKDLHPHHVTYEPSLVKRVCPRCHARITYMNTEESRKTYTKLTNEQRLAVWSAFLEEVIEDDLYEEALDWFNDMQERRYAEG